MTDRTIETSPQVYSRIAGVFYLLTGLVAFDMVFVLGRLVVSGDTARTATNILAHEPLFRLGFAAGLIGTSCYIAVTALFYELFKPVNRSLSLLAAFFSLMGCATYFSACLFHLAPLVVLGGAQYLSVFKVEQLQALALMFLKLNAQGFNIGLIFFGFYCLLIGYLIFRSTFLPRIVGVLMMSAGVSYLTFLSPPLAKYLYPYILVFPGLGEGSLMLWLLVKGVDVRKWKEKATVWQVG